MVETLTQTVWSCKPVIGHPALKGTARDVYSQFGEDGLIAASLELVGVEHKWCFEVGAADGSYFSNTKLLRDADWSAVLVEADSFQFDKLRAFESPKVRTIHGAVGPVKTIDGILMLCDVPLDLELVVIDIDGQDYYAWDDMKRYRPRLVLIEFAPARPEFLPLPNVAGQAGLQPILALGRDKGYVALAKTYCNVLFAAEEYLE